MALLTRLPILACSAVFCLAGCDRPKSPSADSSEIKIGEFASLTGATADFGASTHNGTILAIEETNAKGGILGKKVHLISEDNRSQAGESSTVVRKLISQDKVVGLIGEVVSSRSLEAAPIAQQNRVPMISPASTAPKLTETGDYIFRVCFIDPFQGSVLSKFALSKSYRKVAILTDVKSDYSVSLTRTFKEHFTANGGSVTKEQVYSSGDKDFKAQLTSIKGSAPDALFVPGYYAEVSLIALQARQLGLDVPLFGGDGWDSGDLVKVAGNAIEGGYFSTHFSTEDTSPVIQEFLKRYEARFKSKANVAAALGYDATRLLIDGIKRAGSEETEKIRMALAATKNFPGVTGSIRIDEQRNAVKPAVILQVRDGAFHFVESVQP